MSSSSLYSRTAIHVTGVSGLVFDSVVTLAGSSTIIALSVGIDLSVNRLRNVGTCSGWGATTLAIVVGCALHVS